MEFPVPGAIGHLRYKMRGASRLEILEGSDIPASTDQSVLDRITALEQEQGESQDPAVDWSDVVNTPDTLAGYGITDAWTKDEADSRYPQSAELVWYARLNAPNVFSEKNTFPAIQLDTAGLAECAPGVMKWDPDEETALLCTPYKGVSVDMGKEIQVDLRTVAGGAAIPNGRVVAFREAGPNGSKIVELADNTSKLRRLRIPYAVTTMEIPANGAGKGRGTRIGDVKGVEDLVAVSGVQAGLVFLSTQGLVTNIPPSWPDAQVVIGAINTDLDRLAVDIRDVTIGSAFDSTIIEQQDVFLVRDGTDWYVEAELNGGGDLNVQINGDWFLLDCTTNTGTGGRARSDAITMGTDADPADFFAWVELRGPVGGETPVLRAGTALPADPQPHAQVARGAVWSDAKTLAEGPLSWQRTTDAIAHNGQGRQHHIGDWIRGQPATWMSGCDPAATITPQASAPDLVQLTTASGVIKQMHDQTWPAYDVSTDGLWVANASSAGALTPWQRVTDSNQLLETATGAAIPNNKFFTLVYFMVQNKGTGDCKLCVNLPVNYYSSATGAYTDPNNYAVTSVPTQTRSTAALLCAVPYRYTNAGGGTWEFAGDILGLTSVINLRGVPPGLAGTASGGAAQQFSDAVFAIFDDADSTKVAQFECSAIGLGVTRTYGLPDRDMEIEKHESRARKWVLT